MFDFAIELTDEELQSVSGTQAFAGTGIGGYGMGTAAGAGLYGIDGSALAGGLPALGLGIGSLGLGGCAASSGPYIFAHNHSAASSLAYTTSLRQSQTASHSVFSMIG